MAENTGTTSISQSTLNSLTRSGQNSAYDNSMFNSRKVDAMINPYSSLPAQSLQALQLTQNNAPNTSVQNRELANATFGLNAQAFNSQQQAILSNQTKQVRDLGQSAKDAQSTLAQNFGLSNLATPEDSSRNFSQVTDVSTKLRGAVSDITNQSLNLLNQNSLNFSQSNVQALGQQRSLDFQDRGQQFSEDMARGQEMGNQFKDGKDIGTRTLAGQGFDFNKEASVAGLTGEFRGGTTLQGRLTNEQIITSRLNQAMAYSNLTGDLFDTTGLTSQDGILDPATGKMIPFDPTKQSANKTRTLSQSNFEKFQAPLLQQEIDVNAALIKGEYAQKLADAKIAELVSKTAQSNSELNFYSGASGNADAGAAMSNFNGLLSKYLQDPSEANGIEVQKAQSSIKSTFGSDFGTYYTFEDRQRSPTDPSRALKPDEKGLSTHGYNGNSTFTSNVPNTNAELAAFRGRMTKNFVENIATSGNSADFINKMFFTPETGDRTQDNSKVAIALRAYTKDAEGKQQLGGYNFSELNLSGMQPKDRENLKNAIAAGEFTGEDGKKTSTDNKNFDNLSKIIEGFKSKGLTTTNLTTEGFYQKMDDYRVGSNQPLDGITNKNFFSMVLLGSQPGGVSTYLKDAKFVNLRNDVSSLDTLTSNINSTITGFAPNPGFADTDRLIKEILSKKDEKGRQTVQLRSKDAKEIAGVKFEFNPSDIPFDLIKNLTQWKNDYRTNPNFANQGLYGILAEAGQSSNVKKPKNANGVFGASTLDFFNN